MTDHSQITEFVGTAIGDTIGLVIPGIDPSLAPFMKLGEYRSIGIFGGRVAVGPQVIAVDEAVKAADVELISMEASRDSKGGAGCGTLFYIGANDVSDARHAVEIALEQLPKQFGEVYVNDAGHLSFSYTARAGQCCVKTLGAVEGKAFGIICCGPAAIGCLVSDLAVKSAPVTVIGYHHLTIALLMRWCCVSQGNLQRCDRRCGQRFMRVNNFLVLWAKNLILWEIRGFRSFCKKIKDYHG